MEEEGTVSVWIGRAVGETEWAKAIEIETSLDGETWGSPFTRAFGIDFYDDDFQEAMYYPRGRARLDLFLQGVSYADQVIPQIEQLDHKHTPDDNCFVLLYNFNYSNGAQKWESEDVALRFVGKVAYTHR